MSGSDQTPMPELDLFMNRLQTLGSGSRETDEALYFYRCLLPAMRAAREGIPPGIRPGATSGTTAPQEPAFAPQEPAFAPQERALAQKLSAGIPLLLDEVLEIRPADSQRVFAALCAAAAQGCDTPPPGSAAPDAQHDPHHRRKKVEAIQAALANGGTGGAEWGALDPHALMFMMADGGIAPDSSTGGSTAAITRVAEQHQLDPALLLILTQNTFKVFLRAWRADLEPRVDLSDWKRGLCPFCGTPPGLAEMRGVESARHLRCLACGADWPYPNLTCAFCGSDDHNTLGVLRLDTQVQRAYVHTCDRCRHYIKTIHTFDPTPADLLIIADLETLPLDQIARDRGYF